MGYGGQTANGLSSLGPKMGKASGGGVKLEQGMGKISESQDDVLSGKETQMEDNSMGSAKMISGSHSKGKFMAPPKYKGPEKALVGKQNKLPQELKDKIEAAPGKYTDPKNESSEKQKKHQSGTNYGWKDHKDKKGIRGGFDRAFGRAKAGGYDTFSFGYDKNKDKSITGDEVTRYSTKTK